MRLDIERPWHSLAPHHHTRFDAFPPQNMPRDEFTAEAFFKGFTEGWADAGGEQAVSTCPVPRSHFEEVEYLIDQVICRSWMSWNTPSSYGSKHMCR